MKWASLNYMCIIASAVDRQLCSACTEISHTFYPQVKHFVSTFPEVTPLVSTYWGWNGENTI